MIKEYFEKLSHFLNSIEVYNVSGEILPFENAISEIISLIGSIGKNNKVFFVGNGGSASIANHMTADFIKNAEIPAVSISDSSLLTCLSNDLGYENVFSKPINVTGVDGDILIAISSSGQSRNILNAAEEANNKGLKVITLSGFKNDNPLRSMGDYNFYVPSSSYGFVEIIHLIICHIIAERLMK
jgi:D-sedoheptulose 7-phosphate isomerase